VGEVNVEDLWILEMGDAAASINGLDAEGKLRLMADAVEDSLSWGDSPLLASCSVAAVRLVKASLGAVRAGADASSKTVVDLLGEMDGIINLEAGPSSVMISASIDLLMSIEDGPRAVDVTNVLFSCYDATVQSQHFGRVVSLEDQLASNVCVGLIRRQKQMLASVE
jgi:hypothetical protein